MVLTGDPLLPWMVVGLVWGAIVALVTLRVTHRPLRPSPLFLGLLAVNLVVAAFIEERTQIFALAAGIVLATGLAQLIWWRRTGAAAGRSSPGTAPGPSLSRDPG